MGRPLVCNLAGAFSRSEKTAPGAHSDSRLEGGKGETPRRHAARQADARAVEPAQLRLSAAPDGGLDRRPARLPSGIGPGAVPAGIAFLGGHSLDAMLLVYG